MSSAYNHNTKRSVDDHLRLQQQQQKASAVAIAAAAAAVHRKHTMAPAPPPMPAASTAIVEPLRLSSDSSTTEIYVINHSDAGNARIDQSDPNTLDRKQHNRLSWINMRRKGDETATNTTATSSPQTTRSYVSTVATSGRISAGGVTTISGSNNTLNDIHSDYHSNEAASSTSDYRFARTSSSSVSSPHKNLNMNISSNASFNMANGSTVKLLPVADDESNQQTKCSAFRGMLLCICLNVTYANVVRFPRELDQHGSVYLIPYVVLLFIVGLPVMLLEISVGQFLGQGAAHTWRASPIFKGACILSRFASFLSTVWISLQAVLAVAYIGMFSFNTLPFRECIGNLKALALNGYTVIGNSGQECLLKTFLTPFWENPLYLGLLSIGLFGIWIVVMLCTHNGKILRRMLYFLGLLGFALLFILLALEVDNSLTCSCFPEFRGFEAMMLVDSNLWFNALMQVLFATNSGFGALPMITGKFLYKNDAVRTSVVYLCFNLLINTIAVTLFIVQFKFSANGGSLLDELKPMSAVYDRVVFDESAVDVMTTRVVPILVYILIVIAALISIMVAIYTATRLVPRHPNYVISLIALVMSIISLAAPKFIIARIMDSRIVGTLLITALIFELIAITWIYGAKNIYTDLEFSIGRPIFKGWMGLWCMCPAILTALLVWWCSDDDQWDLMAAYVPRWAPIIFALAVIFVIACIQICRQVEYNFFGMICEASKPAKEWGPADPLARHAWKQWRSVCQDTGRRDFTLRRRGTRDYTHSIKKGQYSSKSTNGVNSLSTGIKYSNGGIHHTNGLTTTSQPHWKSSTPGNSSPNYSGSVFGDSAIEEDISVDKYSGMIAQPQQYVPFVSNDGVSSNGVSKGMRYPQSVPPPPPQRSSTIIHSRGQDEDLRLSNQKHREIVYIRRLSDDGRHATRIEITPSNESITYGSRNPLGRAPSATNTNVHVKRSSSVSVAEYQRNSSKLPPRVVGQNGGSHDHICWRKFAVNAEEYSTEL